MSPLRCDSNLLLYREPRDPKSTRSGMWQQKLPGKRIYSGEVESRDVEEGNISVEVRFVPYYRVPEFTQ